MDWDPKEPGTAGVMAGMANTISALVDTLKQANIPHRRVWWIVMRTMMRSEEPDLNVRDGESVFDYFQRMNAEIEERMRADGIPTEEDARRMMARCHRE